MTKGKNEERADKRQEWFTPNEAAEYLRVTRQTIYTYMQKGVLQYYELPGERGRRIRRDDLDALLQKPSKGE